MSKSCTVKSTEGTASGEEEEDGLWTLRFFGAQQGRVVLGESYDKNRKGVPSDSPVYISTRKRAAPEVGNKTHCRGTSETMQVKSRPSVGVHQKIHEVLKCTVIENNYNIAQPGREFIWSEVNLKRWP